MVLSSIVEVVYVVQVVIIMDSQYTSHIDADALIAV